MIDGTKIVALAIYDNYHQRNDLIRVVIGEGQGVYVMSLDQLLPLVKFAKFKATMKITRFHLTLDSIEGKPL